MAISRIGKKQPQLQRHGRSQRYLRISSFRSVRFIIICLAFIAIVPPIFFHFRLRRFHQVGIYCSQNPVFVSMFQVLDRPRRCIFLVIFRINLIWYCKISFCFGPICCFLLGEKISACFDGKFAIEVKTQVLFSCFSPYGNQMSVLWYLYLLKILLYRIKAQLYCRNVMITSMLSFIWIFCFEYLKLWIRER